MPRLGVFGVVQRFFFFPRRAWFLARWRLSVRGVPRAGQPCPSKEAKALQNKQNSPTKVCRAVGSEKWPVIHGFSVHPCGESWLVHVRLSQDFLAGMRKGIPFSCSTAGSAQFGSGLSFCPPDEQLELRKGDVGTVGWLKPPLRLGTKTHPSGKQQLSMSPANCEGEYSPTTLSLVPGRRERESKNHSNVVSGEKKCPARAGELRVLRAAPTPQNGKA